MASIKPNTHLKAVLVKKEKQRIAERTAHELTLRNLIASLPKVNPADIPQAVRELLEAAEVYKASKPLKDSNGRSNKLGIAEARSRLFELHDTMCEAESQISSLPVNALAALTEAHDSTLFGIKADLAKIIYSIETALYCLLSEPDKPKDHARHYLAREVALIMRDVLKMKVASSTSKQLKAINARGGAAYARILGATLNVAGVVGFDAGQLVATGIRLLNDPELPSRR